MTAPVSPAEAMIRAGVKAIDDLYDNYDDPTVVRGLVQAVLVAALPLLAEQIAATEIRCAECDSPCDLDRLADLDGSLTCKPCINHLTGDHPNGADRTRDL